MTTSLSFGTKFSNQGLLVHANAVGVYGVSQYLRIWDELDVRPLAQAGIWGPVDFSQGVASASLFPNGLDRRGALLRR